MYTQGRQKKFLRGEDLGKRAESECTKGDFKSVTCKLVNIAINCLHTVSEPCLTLGRFLCGYLTGCRHYLPIQNKWLIKLALTY